ncbi:MAG: MFS transporter [Deltaproteobacteria bacterium]|nr:MFS transporter [Deltaproteobacteria bacterium]
MGLPALSIYWFLYLGALGILFPFFSLYLSDNAGLSATQVGVVVTMSPLLALVAPTAWGQLADRARSRVRVLALATLGAAVFTATLAALRGFAPLLAGAAALAAFSTGVVPLIVSVTLGALGDGALHRFGLTRVWGTVGFLVLVVVFPPALHRVQAIRGLEPQVGGPAEPGLALMFPVASVLMLAAVLAARVIPERKELALHARRGDWLELRRHAPFVRALGFAFCASLFLQGPMSLFPLYVRARGGGLDSLSRMWILMLLPEIPLVAFAGTALRRVGPRGLLALGVAAGGLRWLVCGLVSDRRAIYATQLLHGVTVAGLGVGGPLYVESVVPSGLRSTGQGLNAVAGVGVGAIVSNVAAGWLMDHVSTTAPFLVGGAGALALAALTPVLLPPPRRPRLPAVDEGRRGD